MSNTFQPGLIEYYGNGQRISITGSGRRFTDGHPVAVIEARPLVTDAPHADAHDSLWGYAESNGFLFYVRAMEAAKAVKLPLMARFKWAYDEDHRHFPSDVPYIHHMPTMPDWNDEQTWLAVRRTLQVFKQAVFDHYAHVRVQVGYPGWAGEVRKDVTPQILGVSVNRYIQMCRRMEELHAEVFGWENIMISLTMPLGNIADRVEKGVRMAMHDGFGSDSFWMDYQNVHRHPVAGKLFTEGIIRMEMWGPNFGSLFWGRAFGLEPQNEYEDGLKSLMRPVSSNLDEYLHALKLRNVCYFGAMGWNPTMGIPERIINGHQRVRRVMHQFHRSAQHLQPRIARFFGEPSDQQQNNMQRVQINSGKITAILNNGSKDTDHAVVGQSDVRVRPQARLWFVADEPGNTGWDVDEGTPSIDNEWPNEPGEANMNTGRAASVIVRPVYSGGGDGGGEPGEVVGLDNVLELIDEAHALNQLAGAKIMEARVQATDLYCRGGDGGGDGGGNNFNTPKPTPTNADRKLTGHDAEADEDLSGVGTWASENFGHRYDACISQAWPTAEVGDGHIYKNEPVQRTIDRGGQKMHAIISAFGSEPVVYVGVPPNANEPARWVETEARTIKELTIDNKQVLIASHGHHNDVRDLIDRVGSLGGDFRNIHVLLDTMWYLNGRLSLHPEGSSSNHFNCKLDECDAVKNIHEFADRRGNRVNITIYPLNVFADRVNDRVHMDDIKRWRDAASGRERAGMNKVIEYMEPILAYKDGRSHLGGTAIIYAYAKRHISHPRYEVKPDVYGLGKVNVLVQMDLLAVNNVWLKNMAGL